MCIRKYSIRAQLDDALQASSVFDWYGVLWASAQQLKHVTYSCMLFSVNGLIWKCLELDAFDINGLQSFVKQMLTFSAGWKQSHCATVPSSNKTQLRKRSRTAFHSVRLGSNWTFYMLSVGGSCMSRMSENNESDFPSRNSRQKTFHIIDFQSQFAPLQESFESKQYKDFFLLNLCTSFHHLELPSARFTWYKGLPSGRSGALVLSSGFLMLSCRPIGQSSSSCQIQDEPCKRRCFGRCLQLGLSVRPNCWNMNKHSRKPR